MPTDPFKVYTGISVQHLLLVRATFLTESIKLQREAARLPSTCPSGLPSAWNTDVFRRKTQTWEEATRKPSCSWFFTSYTGQFIGSVQLWEGVASPALGNISGGAVNRSDNCAVFTVCHIPTKIVIKTQQEREAVEPKETDKWIPWLALSRRAGEVKTAGVFASQTSHNRPPSRDMGFWHWE